MNIDVRAGVLSSEECAKSCTALYVDLLSKLERQPPVNPGRCNHSSCEVRRIYLSEVQQSSENNGVRNSSRSAVAQNSH